MAGLFENIRANTQGIARLHDETAKNINETVLPMLERLHKEVRSKAKELDSSAGKQSKAVEKARNNSQKHIELLGQFSGTSDAKGANIGAADDPYLLQRGIRYRLNQQIQEENNSRDDLLAVQKDFQQFEAHVLSGVQNALGSLSQYMGNQADRYKAMFGDMAGNAEKIPPDFEWNGFVKRNEEYLIDPSAPPRRMSHINYANQDHRSTKALIEGTLERKAHGVGALAGFKPGFYAVTLSGYLHGLKDNDDLHKDSTPELSLKLADCSIGNLDGVQFSVKGKDVSGSKLGKMMHMSSENHFKAESRELAQQWHSIISAQAGHGTESAPTSPVDDSGEGQATSSSIDKAAASGSQQGLGDGQPETKQA